jgi:hypothetical protein
MVKFGRKFFFDTKHSKKRRIITYIVAGVVLILLIIIIALIIKAINKKPKTPKKKDPKVIIRNEVEAQLYEALPDKTTYFEVLENFDINKITVSYPEYLPKEEVFDDCTDEQLGILEEIKNGKNPDDYKDPYACVK